ncbi:NAD-dependent epimerase/dehydratase family protein [Leifsonia sp. NPDC014704]|uniref:NAD-dependent epimerase/dehydratase family protein n=1 Tax=Leifsonia sp. NPDC014704 TaxID=3364123 RepID=UPI0036F49007
MSGEPGSLPSRVLVTGADGSIGRATTERLLDRGVAVTALSLAFDAASPADRVVVGDARDEDVVARALEGVDAVVHLAAIPHPSLGTPSVVFGTNVVATFTVLAQAGQAGIRRAVIASSINAFGVPMNTNDVSPAYFPLDEGIPTDIADAYSLSKQADEATARMAWRRWGIDVVALRFPLIKDSATLRRSAESAALDPGSMAREGWAYLDIRDGVRAIELAVTVPLTGAHVVGLSADDLLVDRPAAELLRTYAPDVPVRMPIGEHGPLVDTTRARELLGFEPLHSIHRPDGASDELELGALRA